MVWLPVLHRLSAAELAKHNTKCKSCKAFPIVGFRYHCLKCFNVDLCHNCFFVGKLVKGHKADHPMQEYCTSTGTSVNLKNFGQAFRNSFRSKKYFKKKKEKLSYLPVRSVLEGDEFETPSLSPNMSLESREFLASQNGGGRIFAQGIVHVYSIVENSFAKLKNFCLFPSSLFVLLRDAAVGQVERRQRGGG